MTTENVTAVARPSEWASLRRAAGVRSKRLLIPTDPSPERVVVRDLRRGSGAALELGDEFTANYMVFDYATGKLIDNRWTIRPELFRLGINYHVDAWATGLKGMRAGGLRELISPSSLAYGDGPLVYLVKLVSVNPR